MTRHAAPRTEKCPAPLLRPCWFVLSLQQHEHPLLRNLNPIRLAAGAEQPLNQVNYLVSVFRASGSGSRSRVTQTASTLPKALPAKLAACWHSTSPSGFSPLSWSISDSGSPGECLCVVFVNLRRCSWPLQDQDRSRSRRSQLPEGLILVQPPSHVLTTQDPGSGL